MREPTAYLLVEHWDNLNDTQKELTMFSENGLLEPKDQLRWKTASVLNIWSYRQFAQHASIESCRRCIVEVGIARRDVYTLP